MYKDRNRIEKEPPPATVEEVQERANRLIEGLEKELETNLTQGHELTARKIKEEYLPLSKVVIRRLGLNVTENKGKR